MDITQAAHIVKHLDRIASALEVLVEATIEMVDEDEGV